MKITIAQQDYKNGNFEYNYTRIKMVVEQAIKEGSSLVIFGELAVCGYAHYDDIFYPSFLTQVEANLEKIKNLSKGISIIIGAPRKTDLPNGRKFKNAAYLFQRGDMKCVIDKTLLPYFDIFEEEKYYERGINNTIPIQIDNKKILLNICADMWAYQSPSNYTDHPLQRIAKNGKSDFIVNISASPYDYKKITARKAIIKTAVQAHQIPFIYCNLVGAYGEITFDGQSLVFDKHGNCVLQMKAFEEDVKTIDLDNLQTLPIVEETIQNAVNEKNIISFLQEENKMKSILACLEFSLKSFLTHVNSKKILIASSGGVDSAVCMAIASKVLPKEQILSLNLPSQFNSTATVKDAKLLANNLGVEHMEINIQSLLDTYLENLRRSYKSELTPLTKENLQSRIRASLIMAIANDTNALVINTSNKSELATGYGTLYGDMIGAISLLGDLFKTEVFALANILCKTGIQIPKSIIHREPSAELSANQKDSDSLPSYDILDSILYFFIHQNEDYFQLTSHRKFPKETVEKVLHLFKKSQFKRNQFCPIIRVSDKAFGQGKKHLVTSYYDFK